MSVPAVRSHGDGASLDRFDNVAAMLAVTRAVEPVYCLYPHVLHAVAARFVDGFPGEVLYAVKANPSPHVLEALFAAGVRSYDTASLPEVELVRRHLPPAARCYYMAPVRFPGAALAAWRDHGVRDFVVDHPAELERLLAEVPGRDLRMFVRLKVPSANTMYELSSKFGATVDEAVALLRQVEAAGLEPAISFNVGSLVRRPDAYVEGIGIAREVLRRSGVEVRALDVGGGFPSRYVGLDSDEPERFFKAISVAREDLGLASDIDLLAEPGRALCAAGLSVVTRVLLRKDDRLYLNDGIYGSLNEPALSRGDVEYPVRAWRGDGEVRQLEGPLQHFTLYGPTCDSLDLLPKPLPLPADIAIGDWIEFGMAGAYSLSMRTRFNGFHPEDMVVIDNERSLPPPV